METQSILISALYIILDSIVGTFAILVIVKRQQFNYQYLALKANHDDLEKSLFDHATSQKILRWSVMIFTGTKCLCGIPLVVFYVVVPLIKFMITMRITDLIAMPFQIFYLEGGSIWEVSVNIIHQMLIGVITFIYVFFLSNHFIIYIMHVVMKGDAIIEILKEKQETEKIREDEFKVWHKTLTDSTNDLTE